MKYNCNECCAELSVKELCERAFLGGSLDTAYRANTDALPSGIYEKLQREADGFYDPEKELTNTSLSNGLYYYVTGQFGVISGAGASVVDLVKGVRGMDFVAPPKEMFLAELKCLSYFYALKNDLEAVNARLTYVNTDNEKTKCFKYRYKLSELKEFYFSLLKRISFHGEFVRDHTEIELPTAATVAFPYPELREGQEIMIKEAYSAIKKGKRFFAEAPTGTGKTVSALYPAIRALGEGYCDKIFYLTSKASTRSEAYRAVGKLHEAGAKIRVAVITAKEQVCSCGARLSGLTGKTNLCNSKDCENARGYYDRAEAAIKELISGGNGYPRKLICDTAKKYGICPYELSLDLSELCDVIICDYNYAFDPSVYFKRYFDGDDFKEKRYVFLIDEAHNLADRARDMYSAELRLSDLTRVFSALDGAYPECADVASGIESLAAAFWSLRRLCKDNLTKDSAGMEMGFFMSSSPVESIDKQILLFKNKADTWLKKNRNHEMFDTISSLLQKVRKYTVVKECFDKGFRSYVEVNRGDITVKIYCLDPSPLMDSLLNRARASVLFSATLTPREYFTDVLGGRKNTVDISLPSPFARENLCVAVASYLSTRFEDRKKNAARFAAIIAASVCSKHGNYIAYFPSYACLEEVLGVFRKKYPNVDVVVQKQGMSIREREEFLGAFKNDTGHLRVGFCVLGGAFAEGVDLPGSRLIGVIIFGVGLPGLSNERNIIQEYFDMNMGNGYDYAYTYPGMNNVLQAAGRVIRRDDDRGIVVLADDRYGTPKYRELFPDHWTNAKYAENAQSLAEIIRRFWERGEKNE